MGAARLPPAPRSTPPNLTIGSDSASTPLAYDAFGMTRGFDVTPGTFTVNLVCDVFSGTVTLEDSNLTAVFVAQ